MTARLGTVAVTPASNRDVGGPSALDRELIYARSKLTAAQIDNAESMVLGSGLREVGAGALNNVRVQLPSKKNRSTRVVESHTCELLFAYELEMDPAVVGYYAQVPCRRIVRVREDGKRHISQATLDFLVFYEDAVKLVECKYEKWIEREAGRSTEWKRTSTGWTVIPYESWASAHGLGFEVWRPSWPVGVYLQNMETVYAMKDAPLNPGEVRASNRAKALIATAPRSITELCEAVDGFRERVALWLLAGGDVFGPLRSTAITMTDRFYLYADSSQAAAADELTLAQVAGNLRQPVVQDPLINASVVDYRIGSKRLARLQDIAAGRQAPTRRMTALANRVEIAVSEGQSSLGACLPAYFRSGNRRPRLQESQLEAVEFVVRTQWNRATVRSVRTLWFLLVDECERRGVPAPSMTALRRAVAKEDATKRALAHGGMREYQSVRTRSDPRYRSMQALAYGHTLHIDSSKFDNRCAPDVKLGFPAEAPTFYIGVDEATSMTMAHSLIFGSARTDGFAILIREFVFRHEFLPAVIWVDRGSENKSGWLVTFCFENGITLKYSPTGGSRFNSQAEGRIKQINENVAHDFVGSTEPDMAGRKVDGKFKSRKNARTMFIRLVDALKEYVYGDLPKTPLQDGGTPEEKKEESLARYGILGGICKFDDALLIQTSVLVKYTGKATEKAGIRTVGGFFTSEELKIKLRTHQPDEVRRDCVDPSLLYVHVDGIWIKAFNNLVQSIALLSSVEKLFELLQKPSIDRDVRTKKLAIDLDRFHRHQAEAARQAHPHLAPTPKELPLQGEELPDQFGVAEWDSLPPLSVE